LSFSSKKELSAVSTLLVTVVLFIIESGGKFDREIEDKCDFFNPCLDQVA
jgi:hypothetical protein